MVTTTPVPGLSIRIGALAVPTTGVPLEAPDVVEGAFTTRLVTAAAFFNGVVITGTVVPAGAVAEVIVVAALGALTVAEAAVTAGDPAVGTTIAVTPPSLVIAVNGVVVVLGALTVAEAAVTEGDPAVGTTIADTAPRLVIAGTGVELTELFTASCGLAIGGTYCPVACSAISLL